MSRMLSPTISVVTTSTPGIFPSMPRATNNPTPSSDRMGLPIPRTRTFILPLVSFERCDDLPRALSDVHRERHLSRQRMSSAPEAGIVGPERHFDPVKHPFLDLVAFYESLSRLLDREANGG